MTKKTYGLIGYPLGHSFSKSFFTEKFKKEAISAAYLNFEIKELTQLPSIINETENLQGFNVTIPYKEKVFPYLDSYSPEAKAIGAVNVVKVISTTNGKKLVGFNSDYVGFMKSIRPLLKKHHKRALILGTGGSSKAIAFALQQLNIAFHFVSRVAREGQLTYELLNKELLQNYQVVVNCTPVGMFPHEQEAPLLPYTALGEEHLLYDLVYNPLKTTFMIKGEERGATVKNGLEMLHLQAIEAWNIWNSNHSF